MELRKFIFGVSLLGLLGPSGNAFSQDFESAQKPPKNPKKYKSGLELGIITNKGGKGMTASIYFSNPKVQIGGIIEGSTKEGSAFFEDEINLLKFGIGSEYFPADLEIIRPYIGSEVKYEKETLFVPKENRIYKKNGIGLEIKAGTELKPLKYSDIKLFLELGYNISIDKKHEGYPEIPRGVKDKFITVAGIKF